MVYTFWFLLQQKKAIVADAPSPMKYKELLLSRGSMIFFFIFIINSNYKIDS